MEARTVDEAYSSACNTSNLSVKAEQRNDADETPAETPADRPQSEER